MGRIHTEQSLHFRLKAIAIWVNSNFSNNGALRIIGPSPTLVRFLVFRISFEYPAFMWESELVLSYGRDCSFERVERAYRRGVHDHDTFVGEDASDGLGSGRQEETLNGASVREITWRRTRVHDNNVVFFP